MKSLLSLVPLFELLTVSAVVVSCSNSEARFAKEIPGVWQGTPEMFVDNSASTATIIDTFDFAPVVETPNSTLTGNVTVTGMVSTTTQLVGDSAFIEPLTLTVSAHTTISGTWTVTDDDEITLALDPSSLTVDVDPDAVLANDSSLPLGSPAIDSIKPAACKNIEQSIRAALTARYTSMRKFDDVKVKGQLLKYEFNNQDFTLTRQ